MSQKIKTRLLADWRGYLKNSMIEVNEPVAIALVDQNLAEYIKEPEKVEKPVKDKIIKKKIKPEKSIPVESKKYFKKGVNYMDELEKLITKQFKREGQETKILKEIQNAINNWQKWDTVKKAVFVSTIPMEIAFLPVEKQVVVTNELAIAGIFKKGLLRKLVKEKAELLEPIQKPEDKEEIKQKKVGTKTLIPDLIHLVDDEGTIKYLIQKEGKLIIEEIYTDKEGYTWKPKQDLPIYYVRPDILEEKRELDYSHLLNDVIRFIKSYLELPEEAGYLILALWVFHTYLIEKFNVTPIIYSYGLMETGKTRTGEILKEIAYKCETMTSPTEATLFRSAEYFKNTLIIDEVKLWGKDGNQEVARLIKSRYKRGLKVSRINLNKKDEEQVEYFDVFSPLLISTTESIPEIIESRCIRFTMQKNADPKVEGTIDRELAGDLRNKLTIFRANLINEELKEVRDISRRRLNEILKPLYQILMEIAPDREDDFKIVVKELEEGRKSEEGYSDNALIVNEIVKFYNEEGKTFITNAELTRRINEDKTKDEEFTINKVGWILRPFGFQKSTKGGKVGYIIKIEILKHLIERYNISPIGIKGRGLFST